MKKFTINCDFGGQMSPFAIYVGLPQEGHHPLHFQADWLSKNRGGTIPGEVMDAVTQLQELAEKNSVSLEELCVYALGTEEQQEELEKQQGKTSDAAVIAPEEDAAMPEKHEDVSHAQHSTAEESEDMSAEGGHVEEEEPAEKHESASHAQHDEAEEAEDMASEGGHVEEEQ